MTGSRWLNLFVAKILSLTDLASFFTDQVRAELAATKADVWGGGGTLSPGLGLTVSGSKLTAAGDVIAYDGQGGRILVDASNPEFVDVPFANSGATVYYVGLRAQDAIPSAAEIGADGQVQWGSFEEHVGEVVTPSSVVDNGDGTLTLVLAASGNLAQWGTDTSTRPIVAWLIAPETSGSEATFTGTAAYDGGDSRIEVLVSHVFGQAAPSTTAADYSVLVKGPTIKTTGMASDADYCHVGSITSGVFDGSGQSVLPSYGDLAGLFAAQHSSANGNHLAVTAQSYALESAAAEKVIAIYGAEDFFAYAHTEEILTAAPTVVFTAFDESVAQPAIHLVGAFTGEVRWYMPLRLPGNVSITGYRITALRNGAAAEVECRIVRAVPNSTAARVQVGASVFAQSNDGGSWVRAPKAVVTAIPLTQTDADCLYLELRLKNNGAANATAKFGSLTLYGEYGRMSGAGWADIQS